MSKTIRYSVGLDIAKESFTACVLQAGVTPETLGSIETFENRTKGYRHFVRWVRTLGVDLSQSVVVMESTCQYWKRCAFYLNGQGWDVCLLNPLQIHHHRISHLNRAKTDKVDARLIARFGLLERVPPWKPMTAELEELQEILRLRDHWVEELKREKVFSQNGLSPLLGSTLAKKMVQHHLRSLGQKVSRLQKEIQQRIQQHPRWNQIYELLHSIGGFGWITTAWLIVETREFTRFDSSKQLACFAGVIPVPFESGTSIHKPSRLSPWYHHRLRNVLYMASVCAMRVNPLLRSFYQRLLDRKKSPKYALIALAHKMLRIAFAIVRSGQPFNPLYHRFPKEVSSPCSA